MSDGGEEPGLLAHRCPEGHLTYPSHPVCPDCGREQTETIDLSDRTGEVVTWTESTATPVGVRAPNTVAIVAFEVDASTVRVIGGTTEGVEVGDSVEPVYVEQLREPGAGIRDADAQAWDGYRFQPTE
jgi:uncharacterized OB-fold protein